MSIDHNGYADFDRDDEFEEYDPYYDDPHYDQNEESFA